MEKYGPNISTVYYIKIREKSCSFRTSIEPSVESEGSIEVCGTVKEIPSTIKRMDSLMSQDFYTTLYTSLEGSNTFAEFRIKFGGALRHNYFSCCRFDDIIFVGSYVIFRMFLVSAGTYNYSSCTSDILTNIYLITDGVLSVFVFPVLVLHWKERVGGCVNGSSKVDPGTFWYFVLVVRIMSSTLGAVMLYYNVNRIPEFKCQVGYYLSFTTIILEWSFLLLAILLPLMLYSIAYFCAPAYNTHSRLDGNDN